MTSVSEEKCYAVFWFRRDLRTFDNHGLYRALNSDLKVAPIFIFDESILSKLVDRDDARLGYVYNTISNLKKEFEELGSDLRVFHGRPIEVFEKIISSGRIKAVYCNEDYEPYARQRDDNVKQFLASKGVEFHTFKDQVIFAKSEILTDSAKPYTVYTPYKNKWLKMFASQAQISFASEKLIARLAKNSKKGPMPTLKELGFLPATILPPPIKYSPKILIDYANKRDYPALGATSYLGLSLRFGTVSVRQLALEAAGISQVWLSELIWREFFMQVLWHYPRVENESFRKEYDLLDWRDNSEEFERWSLGETGVPIVDAGMRELNATGFMHNRVRMITANFLTKHLFMHWLKGERYFARRLFDFDLSANNGNWQWSAGSGCDAAPYFRIFNPQSQIEKFDSEFEYVKRWVPEYGSLKYTKAIVDLDYARKRALANYGKLKEIKG
jgi:deoxyribodipyrimidine photo-lyase